MNVYSLFSVSAYWGVTTSNIELTASIANLSDGASPKELSD